MRRPVGIVADDDGNIAVACDDGSVWLYNDNEPDRRWREVDPIPGTPHYINTMAYNQSKTNLSG